MALSRFVDELIALCVERKITNDSNDCKFLDRNVVTLPRSLSIIHWGRFLRFDRIVVVVVQMIAVAVIVVVTVAAIAVMMCGRNIRHIVTDGRGDRRYVQVRDSFDRF